MSYKLLGMMTLAVAVSTALPSAARAATPTPMPGGAYQRTGVTGTLHETIFNGKLRFKNWVLRTSTADEQTPDPGGTALTLTYVVLDGTNENAHGSVPSSIVDADGVVVSGHPKGVYGSYYSLDPGAGARGALLFSLPAGFVPVKILLVPTDGVAIRINLKASDIPVHVAASPSPSPSP